MLVAVAAVAAGCGSHHDGVAKGSRQTDCLTVAEQTAEVNVIRGQIGAGKISKAQLRRAFPSLPAADYSDGGGNLLPYPKLHGTALTYFESWRVRLEGSSAFGTMLANASQRAQDAAQARCSSS